MNSWSFLILIVEIRFLKDTVLKAKIDENGQLRIRVDCMTWAFKQYITVDASEIIRSKEEKHLFLDDDYLGTRNKLDKTQNRTGTP